ncbi:unnamed protein product [Rotaria sordida]|uniref:Fibronectin type III-like domain-containing protein n=1 Tax=Rotaria sordida TaxID=392033 RepID=A0A815P0C0_9BILA|nr:unnamed protein product [Rotaria sordida]
MATAEKITQMVTAAAAIPRLGLPKYQWWSEALHDVAYSPGVIFGGDLPAATSFPMPINLGASFNMNLVYRVANIISTEARAFSNEGQAGLNFFTPNINIFRDPRWGRGQETPGEDPFLTSQYVYALVNGLQRGEDDRYLKLAANCKHFDAYDLENWNGTDRFHFDARVSDQDLVETYLPPFETCIRDARVASIMCSFNAINGVPSCANQFLLETIARESYHLNGFVVGDCGAVSRIMDAHHYTSTVEDTVAVALHAGTDLDCALIGPTANATVLMQGNYHGKAPYLLDPITGIESITTGKSINVKFSYGCSISGTDESGFASAIELARLADVVIFFGGINQSIESEGRDRTSIALPSIQLALLQQIEKVVRSAIHVIIMSGSSLDLSFIRDSTLYGSLIWMGYAGQAGGLAVAKVIFGQYNPGGRLPITIYPASYVDAVSMLDMQMRPSVKNPGRTYKFYTGQTVYEFGSGLSYTTFAYSWSNDSSISSYSIDSLMKDNYDENRVLLRFFRVNVSNTGLMAGDDCVLAFITPPQIISNGQTPPIKQLFGFERIHLSVNETIEVFFPFYVNALLTVARDGSKWLYPGLYRILIAQQVIHTVELQGKPARWS